MTALTIAVGSALTAAPPSSDAAATASWRVERETELRAADGWLTVAGLYFLKPGITFNPYTTCPVPVAQNRLKVAIPAGEKLYEAHRAS